MQIDVLVELIEDLPDKQLKTSRDPYTGVLVVNAIAKKQRDVPYHWVYISKSKTGFYRIGYYSNVSKMFLPTELRDSHIVAVYIEKAFRFDREPTNLDIVAYRMLEEAQEYGFIGEVIGFDYDFVRIAYTWRRPDSSWPEIVKSFLEQYPIIAVGRYATWGEVEGISESIHDALTCLLYTSPSPRDLSTSRMPSSA